MNAGRNLGPFGPSGVTYAPHPESPAFMAEALGLSLDLSSYGSPAIVGPTGKRHHYAHGGHAGQLEATHVLRRLALIRAASGKRRAAP